jgi:hypothetical protein
MIAARNIIFTFESFVLADTMLWEDDPEISEQERHRVQNAFRSMVELLPQMEKERVLESKLVVCVLKWDPEYHSHLYTICAERHKIFVPISDDWAELFAGRFFEMLKQTNCPT